MRWGNKIKISRSSEQTGNLNLNRDVLQRVAGLDLSDRVHEATVFGGRGAYSDVAQGWLKSSERSVPPTKIAIKRLRFHVEPTDMKRVRTSFFLILHHWLRSIGSLAIREGDLRLVKAGALEHSPAVRLCIRTRYRMSFTDLPVDGKRNCMEICKRQYG